MTKTAMQRWFVICFRDVAIYKLVVRVKNLKKGLKIHDHLYTISIHTFTSIIIENVYKIMFV